MFWDQSQYVYAVQCQTDTFIWVQNLLAWLSRSMQHDEWYAKATWLVAIPSTSLCPTFPPVSVFEINTSTARTVSVTRDESYTTLACILQLHSIGLASLLLLLLCFIGLFLSPWPDIFYIFNLIVYLYLLGVKRIKDKVHYSKESPSPDFYVSPVLGCMNQSKETLSIFLIEKFS